MHRAGWQWLLAMCALWVAGCTCGKPPVESELAVGFEQPVDGQRLAQGDDVDPAAEGFQYDVVALAVDSAGRTVTLAKAKLEVQLPGEPSWREGPAAVLDGARVRFPAVTLPGRTNVLRVTVEEAGSKRTATHNQSVTVGGESWSVDILGPAEGQVLREADDVEPATPGYQVRFKLRTSGLAGRAGTLYCGNACGIPTADFTVAPGGTTEVPVTLTEAACEAQVAECYAVVHYGTQDVASSKRSFTLDSVAPRVELSAPVAPVSSATFKVEAVVGCCEDGTVATLSREGQTPLTATVSGGVVSFPEVGVPGGGRFPYTLRVTDSGGNPVERPFEVEVAPTPYALTLSAPTDTVVTDADGDPSNGIQVDVSATTNASDPATFIEFSTAVTSALGTPVRVATTAADGGGRTAAIRVSLAEGNNAVQACVRNPALPATCKSATVKVGTGRVSCRIVSPLPGATLAGSSLPVRVETATGPVTVRLRDASGVETSATGSVSGGISQVEAALSSEGAYQIVADCGSLGVSQALTVTRDTVSPEVLVSVSSDDDASGVLGPQTRDTSALPGTQVIVTARTEPFATVALTGCDPSNNISGAADASGLAVLREVTVPRTGTCTLSVKVTDAAGNSTVKEKALTIGLTGAHLAIVAPAAGRTLGSADGTVRTGGGLTVDVRVSVSAGSSGVLKLFLGTRALGSLPVEASDSAQEKVFAGVELNEGANALRATLVGATGVAACATELLNVDTAVRTLTLLMPSKSTSFNLASDRNAEQPGIQSPLQYSLAGAAAGGRVDICSSIPLVPAATPCRDGSGFYTLATDVPSFVANFTYPDGEYSLKAVLDDASFTDTPPVSLLVDSARPRVTSIVVDQDLDHDGQVNLAELSPGIPPTLTVYVSGVENGRKVQVRDVSGVTLFGQADVSGGIAHVSLTGLPNPVEASYSLVALVTDTAGNANKTVAPSPLDPLNLEAFAQFRLDRLAPLLEDVTPADKTVFGPADDADSSTAGYQVRLSARTSADVGSEGVEVNVTPLNETRKSTPSALKISELFTVPTSGATTYTFRIQATDEAGNQTTVTRTATVDFEPPVLVPVAPTPAAGSQLDSSIVTLRAQVTGAEGRTVSISSIPKDGSSPSQLGTPTVGGDGMVSLTTNLLFGRQDLRFEVSDVVGNTTVVIVEDINVTFVGCDQRFTRPSGTSVTLAQKDDLQPTVPGLQYHIEGVTGVCKGRQVRLFRDSASSPEATTTADAATGVFGFDVTLPDAATTSLRLEMDDGSTPTSVTANISVDITAPVVSNVVPAATTLFYVADSNEAFFRTPVPSNYIADLTPDGDAEAKLAFRVAGGNNGKVRVLYNGVDLVKPEVVLDADDKSLDLPITLPHGTTGSLVIVASDAAGNETRRIAAVTVDVQPPAAPSVSASVMAGAERTASVLVNWSAVKDDGTSAASGEPAGYDLRWTTLTAQAGGITTDALFFNSTKVKQASTTLLPVTPTTFTLTPLPPLASYSLQLRARDEVGNYSRIAAPVTVDNFLRTKEVLNPESGSRFGFLVAAGNLDGSPGDDLAVASFDQGSNRGAVYVYSGTDLFPAGGGAPTPTQTLLPPDTSVQYFGIDLGIGNVGDAAGEGKADLIVGASGWSSNLGRAFLYFGRDGTKGVDTTPLEFRGTVAAGRLGVAARIIGDINGDGLGEVVLSASYENSGYGRVYLFYGRSRADWDTLRVDASSGTAPCTVASVSCYIPATKADRIFTGETPPTSGAINSFGRQRGIVGLGDITGDGFGDFALPGSRELLNRFYLFSGKAVNDATATIPASSALQVLSQTAGTDTRFDGFGTEACANVNLVGGPGRDLVVSYPFQNRLLVYADGGPVGYPPAATLSILGANNFGNGLACADINGDGRLDIVAGTNILSGGSVWVLYNQATPGSEFERSLGGLTQGRLTSSSAGALGVSVATGDFNGDGRSDIVAGDNLDSRGARVQIWY
ncbi:Ig-like domain repeat protein [Vitiosangium sp. GDMCC 1.1324]|uniref:FG-GAP-like repeat-containing protein n=1 Tax=Vitiosangium sp. (strain GDMCC 1.1324) TaxID=2138576 RepID=UPI000D35DEA1|nr:Ig-like domain repeat protein [Vitiosangium sp. GDMCC 1.1324]PTL83808.1 VCBS repeat-containing protein [Vitiosangium sp. GDMCC 1.1324]